MSFLRSEQKSLGLGPQRPTRQRFERTHRALLLCELLLVARSACDEQTKRTTRMRRAHAAGRDAASYWQQRFARLTSLLSVSETWILCAGKGHTTRASESQCDCGARCSHDANNELDRSRSLVFRCTPRVRNCAGFLLLASRTRQYGERWVDVVDRSHGKYHGWRSSDGRARSGRLEE